MSNDTVIASLQEKIDDLNQQAWEARVNDSPKAFQLSQESVNLARNIDYRKGLAEGLRSLGFGYIRLFKNDEAAPLLREALFLFQSLKDVRGQAIIYEYLGIIERNWGNLGGSLELLLKGHALLRQVGSADIEVTSCYQIGVTYKHLGNHENALDYLYRALSIAKKSNIPLMEAYAINIIGSIYFDNGNYKDALGCYQQGLVIRRESHDKWGEAGSLDNIGITYLKLNDLDKAIDYCKQSLKITRSTSDKKGEANTLLHLAEIFRQAGDTGQAAKVSNESLEIRKARGDRRGEAEVLLFLAELYKKRSDSKDHQIYEWLSAALKIADEIKAQDLLSKAYNNLHEYYRQQGNHKESLVQLEAHLQIEKELHKNTINQKVANLEISHKAEVISQRNKELTELNEKIEKANEELKIEASLERVRAVAMGMKEPADMINVCRMISDQLQQLGIKEIRNVQTVIIYPQKHEYLNYQYFPPYDKESIETIDYRLHPDVLDFTNQMLSSPDAYYNKTFEGEELRVWREFRKQTNQLPDPKLDEATSSHYYFYSIGSGALGVTTYAPLSEKEISLFKRFRNVFELAYRRFVDIEKAEAQAREAQIQLALERVRARTMAMQRSDELPQAANLLFQQIQSLGFHAFSTGYNIWGEDKKTVTSWMSSGGIIQPSFKLPLTEETSLIECYEAALRGDTLFVQELGGAKLGSHLNYMRTLPVAGELMKKIAEAGFPLPDYMINHHAFFSRGYLLFITYAPVPEAHDIFKRFAKVFEQTYTRFLDLQKAEAQAREAQIETGLERVRSKTMAMHKSEEVTGVAVSLNEELLKLGFEGGSTIIIMDKETGDTDQWTGFSADKSLKSCYVPYFKHPCHDAQLSAWTKGEEFLVYTVTGDEKRRLDEHYFTTGYKDFPESDKRWMRQMESVTFSHAFMKYGAIHWGPGHLTEEQLLILQRFSKVFEQSYTRFLDLQKAEAQAREAQIEAALERVRSRTMGMHKSDELLEVVAVVFQQMQLLGFNINLCNIVLFNKTTLEADYWVSTNEQEILPESYHIPYFNHPFYQFQLNAWKKAEPLTVFNLEGETKKSWDEILFTQTDLKRFPASLKEMMKELDKIIISSVATKHGLLQVIGHEPLSNEYAGLVSRFAKVFEQTYTRFLDLQKAEAQAREAQIEVALERIRARAMAMHSSSELMDVANILREQMGLLDQPDLETSVVNLFEEDSELIFSWNASRVPGSSEKIISSITSFPKNSSELTKEMMSLYHSGEKEYTLEAAGLKLMEFLKVLIKANPRVADYIGDNPPEKVFYHFTTFTGGNLLTVSYQPPAEETKSLQRRAASVFDMAYRRYLDLKKAEAQTREAQTEVALERIRARAMAMHSSYELMDVAHILREQMGMLDQPDLETSVINLFDEDSDYIYSWHAFREPGSSSGKTINGTVSFRKDSSALTREMIDHYHSGEKEYTLDATGEKLNEFIQVLTSSEPEISNYIGKNPPGRVYYHFATFAGGALLTVSYQPTNEDVKLLQRRAASVFELAYRRYLDLKKAEAQTREAQIEVAVERVRAKALAMHKSEDLHSVVVTLKKELMSLQIPDITAATIYLAQDDASIRILDLSDTGGDNDDDQPQLKLDKIFRLEDTDPDLWIRRMWDRNENYFVLEADEDDFVRVVQWVRTVDPAGAEMAEKIIREKSIKKAWLPTVKLGKGIMNIDLLAPPAPEIESILLKMGAGFDLAYKRFLDLQNAEAQAREAQIEAAVEKVRSRSLAMHKSDELQEVVHTVFERLKELNVDFYTAIIILFKEGSKDIIWWLESKANQQYSRILVPFTPLPYFNDLFETRETGGDLFSKCYSFSEKNELFNHLFQNTDFKYVPEKQKQFLQDAEFATMSVALAKNTGIHITSYSKKSFSDQDNQIVNKFANVFDQAYTRFLDLQKAEAQAREAQIEAALERVRAKVMAMSNSNDLNETSLVFGEQLRKLGIDWQFAYFWLVDESKNENTFWITWPDSKTSFTTYTLSEAEEYFNDCLISWRAGVKIHDNYVPPEGVKEWIDTFQRIADDAGGEAKRIMVPETFPTGVYYYDAMMKYGSFGICISKPATDEEKKIQCRFAIEFERAYTRFLDLKQAEAQAREAKIEAALERVRARAMGMHKSADLTAAVATVFEELDKLNIGILRCGIAIMDKEKPRGDIWVTVKSEQKSTIQLSGDEPLDYHPLLQSAYDAWLKQEDFSYVLEGKELADYYRAVTKVNFQLPISATFDAEVKDQKQFYYNAVFQDGSLFAFMETGIMDEAKMVIKRFANVFNLTYKRFLDLQKAEAQAREAQIELGLERVRARAMAMQKSGELKELIATVSTELSKLDIILDRCFIMIYDIKTLGVTWWMANPETSSDPIGLYVQYHEHAPYLAFLKAWQDRLVKWQYLLEGSAKKTWDEFLFVETELSRLPGFVIDNMRANETVYLSASFNNFGCLTLATLESLSDEQFDIMLRFAKVFDLTYTRFNDLKQAEAQARAAKIEAALERVRARALAMQEPEELKDVAQVLRTEMGLLGVEELETCSIYINDESAEKAECWYALKDIRSGEKKLVNDHFALNLSETWVGREMLQFYQSPQKQISIIMQGENRKEWIHYCEEHSAPLRGYYGEVIPDRTYHLYKFSHGAIGAAAGGDISEESWRMLGRAASVFSLAYSRFKDLTQARIDLIKLKEEKKRAEEALTELQATQKQLIQSEKMASLGELTAGIAHEIQNPLNFVNNFSDVSNELLEEMKQELATGNTQQAIEIVNGVKENLEKILHHGKRADAIVKGMLQHSRASSGQKELTDINMLAEEYLRLAYHGLRAKDKFFNAKFETDLDPTLHKINVVPQEIGRVMLNLINNAFYAVTEKKKSLPSLPKGGQEKTSDDYEPIVTVRTRRLGPPPAGGDRDSVEIRVADNGIGIPQKVLDKIFQPFFTTKPTGQGTGLGLSLSYDIITKGHQGEIKVNTKENEGTEFTIVLPV